MRYKFLFFVLLIFVLCASSYARKPLLNEIPRNMFSLRFGLGVNNISEAPYLLGKAGWGVHIANSNFYFSHETQFDIYNEIYASTNFAFLYSFHRLMKVKWLDVQTGAGIGIGFGYYFDDEGYNAAITDYNNRGRNYSFNGYYPSYSYGYYPSYYRYERRIITPMVVWPVKVNFMVSNKVYLFFENKFSWNAFASNQVFTNYQAVGVQINFFTDAEKKQRRIVKRDEKQDKKINEKKNKEQQKRREQSKFDMIELR